MPYKPKSYIKYKSAIYRERDRRHEGLPSNRRDAKIIQKSVKKHAKATATTPKWGYSTKPKKKGSTLGSRVKRIAKDVASIGKSIGKIK